MPDFSDLLQFVPVSLWVINVGLSRPKLLDWSNIMISIQIGNATIP
jgi:hypothetical protein